MKVFSSSEKATELLRKKELTERLNQHLSGEGAKGSSSLATSSFSSLHSSSLSSSSSPFLFKSSSIPSSSSLDSFASVGMPSAKVGDGNFCRAIQSINCEKTEEDKKRDVELATKLSNHRRDLEDKLIDKLEELKAVCVREGEITGKIPVEIYKTLLPGEAEPVVQRRVGTAFKFSDEVLLQANIDGNKQAQLAIDIELHRKIVAAAERLAKDKSTNKSVRKKRRKDLQVATQKLKGLEKGLHKLRISSSKPDSLNFDSVSMSQCNVGSGFSINSLRGWSNFAGNLKNATKSCPTTPRGSIPDLSTIEDTSKLFKKGKLTTSKSRDIRSSTSSGMSRNATTSSNLSIECSRDTRNSSSPMIERINSKSSNALETLGAQLPPTIPNRRPFNVSSVQDRSDGYSSSSNGIQLTDYKDAPLYANVGYTSSVPYKSAYRQSNFPTIQHQKEANSTKRLLSSINSQFHQPSDSRSSNAVCTRFRGNLESPSTSFSAQKTEGYAHQLLLTDQPTSSSLIAANSQLGSIVRKMSESATPCSGSASSSSSGYVSAAGLRISPSKVLMENSVNALKPPAMPGFSTTSLDRRTSMRAKHHTANRDGKVTDSSSTVSDAQQSVNSLITTFPVNDICRPLEPGDFSKYRSISTVREPLKKFGNTPASASAGRLQSQANGGIASNNWPIHNLQTDPRMEALLATIHSRGLSSNQREKLSGNVNINNYHVAYSQKRAGQSLNSSPSKSNNNNGASKTATIV